MMLVTFRGAPRTSSKEQVGRALHTREASIDSAMYDTFVRRYQTMRHTRRWCDCVTRFLARSKKEMPGRGSTTFSPLFFLWDSETLFKYYNVLDSYEIVLLVSRGGGSSRSRIFFSIFFNLSFILYLLISSFAFFSPPRVFATIIV